MNMDKISTFHKTGTVSTGALKEKKQEEQVEKEISPLEVKDRADISSNAIEKKSSSKKTGNKSSQKKSATDKKSSSGKKKLNYDFSKMSKKDLVGLSIGAALEYGIAATGPLTWLHENGHATMVKAFYQNPTVTVQVDGIDNVKNMINNPSPKNLGRVLSAYDANQDGAGGVTHYNYGDGLNERGQAIGKNGVQAIISAAGCVAEEIPTLIGFAVGFKIRKKSPVAGYALMSMTGLHHFATSMYPLSALWTTTAERPGHDWAKFAEATGIHPLLTAAVFGATLPAMGLAMWHSEKKQIEKGKDQVAVSRLIENGTISEDDLNKAFEKYGRRDKLLKSEKELGEVIGKPLTELLEDKKLQGELRKKTRKLNREYAKFSTFLAKEFRTQVDEEKKQLEEPPKTTISAVAKIIKEDFGKAWDKDKVGTALTTTTLAGSAGVGVASGVQTAAMATGASIAGTLGTVLSKVIPGVSLVGTVAAGWRAKNIVKDPAATKTDKIASLGMAGFSALGTAGLMIPGLGLPAMLVSIGGILGTHAVKALINKFT